MPDDISANGRNLFLVPDGISGKGRNLIWERDTTLTTFFAPSKSLHAGRREGSNNGDAVAWRSWDCSPVRIWVTTALAGRVRLLTASRSGFGRKRVVQGVVLLFRVLPQAARPVRRMSVCRLSKVQVNGGALRQNESCWRAQPL